MKLLSITHLNQTTEIKNTKICPYLTGVQYILLVWLCTHQSRILFLVSHFTAWHNEMMLTLPFKCQKFVTMKEQKCKDWQNHRKNSQQNRSGEYAIKEMAPTTSPSTKQLFIHQHRNFNMGIDDTWSCFKTLCSTSWCISHNYNVMPISLSPCLPERNILPFFWDYTDN
jgi:hypothetical protein